MAVGHSQRRLSQAATDLPLRVLVPGGRAPRGGPGLVVSRRYGAERHRLAGVPGPVWARLADQRAGVGPFPSDREPSVLEGPVVGRVRSVWPGRCTCCRVVDDPWVAVARTSPSAVAHDGFSASLSLPRPGWERGAAAPLAGRRSDRPWGDVAAGRLSGVGARLAVQPRSLRSLGPVLSAEPFHRGRLGRSHRHESLLASRGDGGGVRRPGSRNPGPRLVGSARAPRGGAGAPVAGSDPRRGALRRGVPRCHRLDSVDPS